MINVIFENEGVHLSDGPKYQNLVLILYNWKTKMLRSGTLGLWGWLSE